MSPIASVADSTPARRAMPDPLQATEAASGLSWGAALAGAVAATALSFILVVLGVTAWGKLRGKEKAAAH